jgi:hypothetical protein
MEQTSRTEIACVMVIDSSEALSGYRFGPVVHGGDTTFRLWSPSAGSPYLILEDRDPIAMQRVVGRLPETV